MVVEYVGLFHGLVLSDAILFCMYPDRLPPITRLGTGSEDYI